MARNQQGGTDNELILIFIGVGCLFGAMVLTRIFQEELNTAFAWAKIIETYPYMWWNEGWATLTTEIMGGERDLGAVPMSVLAKYFNRPASIFWLPIYALLLWKMFKMPSKEQFRRVHTPQSLLEQTSKIFSATAPFVYRDITKEDWNLGPWRLMESPLMFLVRNRCLLDPNGDPFRLNMIYECGDTPELYEQTEDEKSPPPSVKMDTDSFDAFRIVDRTASKPAPKRVFVLPEQTVGTPEEEIEKFKKSDLIPSDKSPYMNGKKKIVLNTLDENRLRSSLVGQLGVRFDDGDPFKATRGMEKWRIGLAIALYLHGLSDKTKKDAKALFDSMNYSYLNKGPMDPDMIDIGKAMSVRTEFRADRAYMELVDKHSAWMNPWMMALLHYARRRGVVSNASFGWVRAFDRTLWYALNQTGRNVCAAEAAGAWSHYYAEEAVGHKLEQPYLEIAIEGFRDEMVVEGWLNAAAESERVTKQHMKDDSDNFMTEQARARGAVD